MAVRWPPIELVSAQGLAVCRLCRTPEVPRPAVCLLGQRGGKTTTLRILARCWHRQRWFVDVDTWSRRFVSASVMAGGGVDKILTAGKRSCRGSVTFNGVSGKADAELIDRLGMADWVDRRGPIPVACVAADLAAGCAHPRAGVLDEPTVGLDIESRAAIWELLRQLVAQGTSVLLSSHYLEEIEALADRMAIIDAGRVIAEGTPEGLKQQLGGDRVTLRVREFSNADEAERISALLQPLDGVRQVVVNRAQGYSLNLVIDGDGVVQCLRERLDCEGLPVFALAQSRPSLDDVYLQATGRTLMDAELALAGQRDVKQERRQSMR